MRDKSLIRKIAASTAGRARFANATPEQKEAHMAKMRAAAIAALGPDWVPKPKRPFPGPPPETILIPVSAFRVSDSDGEWEILDGDDD